ncbi:spore coat protein, partial [Shewanella sp. 11B5]
MVTSNHLYPINRLFNQPITFIFALTLSSLLLLTACGGSDSDSTTDVVETATSTDTTDTSTTTEVTDADFEATDWTDETHSKNVDPNFDEVFSDTEVKRLDIVVTEDRWQSMLDDMTALYGEFGRSSSNSLSDTDEDPIFVPAE